MRARWANSGFSDPPSFGMNGVDGDLAQRTVSQKARGGWVDRRRVRVDGDVGARQEFKFQQNLWSYSEEGV